MKRRSFITFLGGAAAAWPLAARAQQPAIPMVGFLGASIPDDAYVTAFRRGLAEAGYVEGRNLAIEFRWVEGEYDRMPAMVVALLQRQPTVIAVVGSTAAVQAATAATEITPIVFAIGADPVKFGLVASINRPGGNVTGVSFLANLLVAKQIEVLLELIPGAATVGFLVNPNNPNAESDTNDARRAAGTVGRKLVVASARTGDDIVAAFAVLAQERANALLIAPDPLFISGRERVVSLASRYALPTMYNSRDYVSAGGLLSYGPDQRDVYRQTGVYVGRILRGEKASDLPVVQPTKFELVINSKTATGLGLTLPPTLLARADDVIE
jgi:putative ABC transport system substrate-binding protein